jgi:hypothetical protein
MARGLRISWAASRYVLGKHDGKRLRITASDPCGMTDKIFAYRMLPLNPQTGEEAGFFSHVCSPVDLEDYPEDGPTPGHTPKWFRLNFVDQQIRSVAEASDLLQAVLEDIRRLKRTLDTMDTLEPAGVEDIGDVCLPEEPPTESSSSAASEGLPSLGAPETLTEFGTLIQNVGDVGLAWE